MGAPSLGSLELAVLACVARLGEDAYGLAVRRDVSARANRDYSVGAIYTTLERLHSKGLVTARVSPPTPTRGGRSRRQFKISANGQRALANAHQAATSMWSGVVISRPRHA
jgi:DNA-binding PadR family transcriptional regulator